MAVFNQVGRGTTSHLVITDRADVAAWQCVDFANTAHTDGNWESNIRALTMEHHGDWRHGYFNAQVIENSAKVVAWLRDQGIINRYQRHRDVSLNPTVCPADLPVERIWNRATEIINFYNQPAADTRPEWLKARGEVPGKTVYAQKAGIFVHNLNAPGTPLDTRRFALNQNFEIKGQTKVGGKDFWITRSSYDANIASGILKSDVADQPFVPPVPQPVPTPMPTTPDWADSLLRDEENREMYVLRATPLIDLENGRPVLKDNKQVWFEAGEIIKDVSAHTIVAGVTYQLTEFSFNQIRAGQYVKYGNGIKSSDLTIDPKACPPGTPANPEVPADPEDKPHDMPDVPTPPPPVMNVPDTNGDGIKDELQTVPPVIIKPPAPTTPKAPSIGAWMKLWVFIYEKFILPRINKKKS